MKEQPTAKEQLASGTITVSYHMNGGYREKQVDVPDWLFDLATHTDEWIFENHLALWQRKDQIEKMSNAMFVGLLIALKADNRPV